MRGLRKSWVVLMVGVVVTVLICSCAAKKAEVRTNDHASASASSTKEKNPLKHEVFLTQIEDVVIVGGDLLLVGKARVPGEAGGKASERSVVAEVNAPFDEKCFSLIRGGLPEGKELQMVGSGHRESNPVQGGDYAISVTFTELLSCELMPQP